LLRTFTTGCQRASGSLLAHVSTVEAARDMDILRALVGDEQINFLGASYGTYLGATYAELFSRRVGRMVLDGAVDPSVDPEQMALVQAASFQTALRAYVSDCVQQSGCPLGTDVDAGLARVSSFFEQVDAAPIAGDGKRQLTQGYAVLGVWLPLYEKSYWPILSNALAAAFQGEGAQLLQLADYYTNRGVSGFTDNSNEAIYAVNCLDHPQRATVASVQRSIPRFLQASPVFGRTFAWGALACSRWPVEAAEPSPPIDGAGAAPIVVIGTTRDPATPYEWAVELADQLQSGVLLSRDGDGHTGYHVGNSCIDEVVESYLVDGTVPADGKEC
jgi:pimeloyl-ACP methyl ester carboxylesterase